MAEERDIESGVNTEEKAEKPGAEGAGPTDATEESDGVWRGPDFVAGEEVPQRYRCRISLQPMVDPVLLVNGQGPFERESIRKWFERCQEPRCPLTNDVLDTARLVPQHELRSTIYEWYRERGVKHGLSHEELDRRLKETNPALDTTEGRHSNLHGDEALRQMALHALHEELSANQNAHGSNQVFQVLKIAFLAINLLWYGLAMWLAVDMNASGCHCGSRPLARMAMVAFPLGMALISFMEAYSQLRPGSNVKARCFLTIPLYFSGAVGFAFVVLIGQCQGGCISMFAPLENVVFWVFVGFLSFYFISVCCTCCFALLSTARL